MANRAFAFRRPARTEGSWWVGATRDQIAAYVRDDRNVARMSAGSQASFVSGGAYATPFEERSTLEKAS